VLRLDGEPRRLVLIEVGGRPDPLEQVETEIAPARLLKLPLVTSSSILGKSWRTSALPLKCLTRSGTAG
jgi:hypothetical protein